MEIGSTSSVNGAARNARRSLLVTDGASLRVKGRMLRYSVYTHLLYRPRRSTAGEPRRPQAYMNYWIVR